MKCKICKKDIRRDEKRHIVQLARFEVWQKAIGNLSATPHFDYYFANTSPKVKTTRSWNTN